MWAFLMTSGNLLEVSSVKVFPKERAGTTSSWSGVTDVLQVSY